jgi:hypothetical protein
MRFTPGRVAAISAFVLATDAASAMAQTRLTSLDELRRELAAGDVVTLVPVAGAPVEGRLVRLGPHDLELRPGTRKDGARRDVIIPLESIRSLTRPRDSARNGALLGAGIGAGIGGAFFIHGLAVDRNELDEWAPAMAAGTALCTGLGALLGWTVDRAVSKPHIQFDAPAAGRATLSVRPLSVRGRGIGLAVSLSR